MSTQLILYPQNYRGFSTSSAAGNEYVVDGQFFTTINSSSGETVIGTYIDIFTAQPPAIVNTWYRARNTSGINYPTQTNNTLVFNFVSGGLRASTVYQKLSNLTVGQSYDLTVNSISNANGMIYTSVMNAVTYAITVVGSSSASNSQDIITFTAQTPNDIVFISVEDNTNNNIVIQSISVRESTSNPSLVYADIKDGQVICDLYQEEDIPLTLSVDNFTNVAEKVQSYSKNFNLPATKRNNRIFNNMFEITRSDDGLIFNPYVKTRCVLKQDGFLLFEGYLRMIDIKEKEGEISYNVNLYSEVIALADTLKDKKFSDLDLRELTSDYNITDIKKSWDDTEGLPLENPLSLNSYAYDAALGVNNTNVMKYPFIDWNHQFYLDNGNPVMPNLNSAFRPCIQVKYLINKIFSESGFTWKSDFFDSTDFGKLFMDFNWGNDENPTDVEDNGFAQYRPQDLPADNFATNTFKNIKFTTNSFPTGAGYDQSTGVFTVPAGQGDTTYNIVFNAKFVFLNLTQPADLELRWLHNSNVVPSTSQTVNAGGVSGSAIAYVDGISGGQITSIALQTFKGGYYDNPPTVTISTNQGAFSSSGSGATATATGTFPGTVTGVTVTAGGSGYDDKSPPYVMFDGVSKAACVYDYVENFNVTLSTGDTLTPQFKTTSSIANSVLQDNRYNPFGFFQVYGSSNSRTAFLFAKTGVNILTNQALLNSLRGDLGQWEFIKGIMTMFNLVSLPDDTNKNNILIEPYSDVFIKHTNSGDTSPAGMTLANRSIEHDWTDKIDVSQMELKPLTDLNKNTIFKFVEDDDDYCFNAYKMATSGGLYGAKYWDASGFTILQGEEEIVAEPFAATVIKPLQSGLNDFIVPSIYSVDESGASDGFDNSPRILYNNGVKTLAATTYTIPAQNNVAGITNENEFLQFSHLSSIPISPVGAAATNDFNFESQQLIQPLDINGMPINNLFYTYWLPYFSELYSPDTRTMILKVNLTPSDIATFKFFDTVMIKNRAFRVNKIEYKPNSLAKVEFILIG